MRLGIFGGTFDPVHYGHLLLAESCREQLSLDAVWFLPTAVPPHKRHRELTPPDRRIEMLELAIGGQPEFSVSRYETDRGGVNYTVDTLAEFHRQDPDRELFFLLGADSLRDLPTWKDPVGICRLATLVIVERSTGDSLTGLASSDDLHDLATLMEADELAEVEAHRVRVPRIDLSSSDLRARVAQDQSIRYQTPRAVEAFIMANGLYRAAP